MPVSPPSPLSERRPLRHALAGADFALRVVFFAVAPYALVQAIPLFPIGGAIATIALGIGGLFVAEAVRGLQTRRPWLRPVLSAVLDLDDFYRERRPKPFLYYVFYPLMLPHWLATRDGRDEFWLYKGYNLVTFLLLVGSSLVRFATAWRPDLTFGDFLPSLVLALAVETIVVMAALMPITTTVVALHKERGKKRLGVLCVVAGVSTLAGAIPLVARRDPFISVETRTRLSLRTKRTAARCRAAQIAAVRAAWVAQKRDPSRIEGDGKLEGTAIEAARVALRAAYKEDEASAFDLWATPRKKPTMIVLYTEGQRFRDPVWVGLRDDGQFFWDPKLLPKGAFAAMQHAIR